MIPPVYRPGYPVTTFVSVATFVMVVLFHWLMNVPAATGVIIVVMGLVASILFVLEWCENEKTRRYGDDR